VRLSKALIAFAFLAAATACGPIQSTSALIDADVELEAARAAGAESAATYEYTSAEVYLHKARETQGRSQYEASALFAARAAELAKVARRKATEASNRPEEAP
jgi:hypothetical protein